MMLLEQTTRGTVSLSTMPSEIETFRISAMNRYLQEEARDAISRAQHATRKENFDLAPGTWVMHFRRGKVTRRAIGAPSQACGQDPLVSS